MKLVMDYVEKFSDASVQILQRECEALNKDVESLEKQLQSVSKDREAFENKIALISAERRTVAKEHKSINEITTNLSEEMHNWDTIVKHPLMHYKDVKQALDDLAVQQKQLQKFILQVDVKKLDVEKAIENEETTMNTNATKNAELIQQAATENRGSISTLQTQLKLIETRKKTMESQLSQKAEENKELTKICEELIKQRE